MQIKDRGVLRAGCHTDKSVRIGISHCSVNLLARLAVFCVQRQQHRQQQQTLHSLINNMLIFNLLICFVYYRFYTHFVGYY